MIVMKEAAEVIISLVMGAVIIDGKITEYMYCASA